MDLADAEAWRDAAKTAYLNALQAQTVAHGGRTVVYQELREMYRQWMLAERAVRAASGGAKYGLADFSEYAPS